MPLRALGNLLALRCFACATLGHLMLAALFKDKGYSPGYSTEPPRQNYLTSVSVSVHISLNFIRYLR